MARKGYEWDCEPENALTAACNVIFEGWGYMRGTPRGKWVPYYDGVFSLATKGSS